MPPNGDQAQEKKVDDKTYYWCPHHLALTIHKATEYHGVGQVVPAADDATDDGDGKKKKNLTFAKALAAMVGASDGEEDEGDFDDEEYDEDFDGMDFDDLDLGDMDMGDFNFDDFKDN